MLEKQSLKKDKVRFKKLIANLEGGVLVEDETRHISLVNQSFCDMFGIPVPPETLIGADCSQSSETSKSLFVKPDEFVNRIDEILAERVPTHGDILHLVDGRVFSRDYIPVFDPTEYIGHLWHYRDITTTFRTQQRLERLLHFEETNKEIHRLFLQLDDVDEALNQALAITGKLLDVSRVYVFGFRENERILDNTHEWCAVGVNPEIENLQGLPFDELFPSFFPMIAAHDLIAPDHISELPDDLRGILEPQDIQTVLWMPMYIHNRIEGFLGYDETRHARRWLPEEISLARIVMECYARALERAKATETLARTRDEALRTAQIRAKFVANMSHEIRTPMTGILGMLELLLETDLDELQQEFTSEAFKSSSNLLTIINDILDFSKLEAGQIVLESEPVDIKAVMTEVKMTLAPQIKDKPVRIEIQIDPDVPYRVYSDATRIRQVLMNLAGNAVKFTHVGQVTLALKVVRMTEELAYLRFSIQDTGIGIAEDNLTSIFESFVQADGTITRKFGGSGLGLSISKQMVELMRGTIDVESTPDVGSVFSFLLSFPIAQKSSMDDTQIGNFTTLHTLIIDPNKTARYVLAQQLEGWGVHTTQIDRLDASHKYDTRFDLLFYRVQQIPLEDQVLKMLSGYSDKIIYLISDKSLPVQQVILEEKYLTTPVDQSLLYNLLIHATYADELMPDQPEPSDSANKRVLLADDYPVNVDLVVRALKNLSIQVDYVENGKAALEKLKDASYDLILMDMQMPEMGGLEATRFIRQMGNNHNRIPILALTASVMRSEQDDYFSAGVDAVISKPFSIKYLRKTVLRWLDEPLREA